MPATSARCASPRKCSARRPVTAAGACGSTATIKPGTQHRGTGAGVRAAAGLIAPGSRRVIVKARYTRMAGGGLEAARAHLRYIQRDGVTPEGERGRLKRRRRRRSASRCFEALMEHGVWSTYQLWPAHKRLS